MISIIIPVYNSEAYIHQCLESIINQTFKNFEVILVDDGSTDGSLDILKYYSNKYENICYLTQNNKGAGAARNLAFNNCKGEYIVYVDSDDYLEATYLEEMLSKIEKTNSDIVICGYNSVYEDTEGWNLSIIIANKFNENLKSYNLSFIIWDEGEFHPNTLKENDIENILHSNKLFVRKFDETIDRNVMKYFYKIYTRW